MWDLPGSGIEPISPALADEFFTTEPPGKTRCLYFKRKFPSLEKDISRLQNWEEVGRRFMYMAKGQRKNLQFLKVSQANILRKLRLGVCSLKETC